MQHNSMECPNIVLHHLLGGVGGWALGMRLRNRVFLLDRNHGALFGLFHWVFPQCDFLRHTNSVRFFDAAKTPHRRAIFCYRLRKSMNLLTLFVHNVLCRSTLSRTRTPQLNRLDLSMISDRYEKYRIFRWNSLTARGIWNFSR